MGPKGQNLSKYPQFCSQKWPTKTVTKSWRFLLYFWFLLSQFLCHLLLVSPFFLLFHDILGTQPKRLRVAICASSCSKTECWKPLSLNFCQAVCTTSENTSEPRLATTEPHPSHIRATLSAPLRLRVQSRSRTQLRIAASIAFFVLKGFRRVHKSTTIARLSPPSGLERGG